MPQIQQIINALWSHLSDRQAEVLSGRFGLEKVGKKMTLAALGKKYGVTRERVRQIEAAGLSTLKKELDQVDACAELVDRAQKFLKEHGGVASREAVLAHLRKFAPGLSENHLSLIAEASRGFHVYAEDKVFWPMYYLDKASFKNVVQFIEQWSQHLRSNKGDALKGNYKALLTDFLKKKEVPTDLAENYLAVSKKFGTSPFGDLGLTEWPEIHPKTIRDRVYLVLKKKNEPLHFRTIAKLINDNSFKSRPASAPTVHNELIKDGRFVLVGRGVYALAEHGYEPGTAKEVIHRILKQQGPMRPREVILAVQKERFFKPNTILVNLQNKSHFRRLPGGIYHIHEA